jgi:hypothetical protein
MTTNHKRTPWLLFLAASFSTLAIAGHDEAAHTQTKTGSSLSVDGQILKDNKKLPTSQSDIYPKVLAPENNLEHAITVTPTVPNLSAKLHPPSDTAYTEFPQSIENDFDKLSPEQIEHKLLSAHPAAYIVYAGKLWAAGKKDESVFWFYVGQLRYRFYLKAIPQNPSGNPAFFSSLMEAVGNPINVYAGSNPKKWVSQMDAVLAWDARTPNDFTSKPGHEKQLIEARDGLVKLKEYVSSNQEWISAQREQNGISQSGITTGVYVDELH